MGAEATNNLRNWPSPAGAISGPPRLCQAFSDHQRTTLIPYQHGRQPFGIPGQNQTGFGPRIVSLVGVPHVVKARKNDDNEVIQARLLPNPFDDFKSRYFG